MFSSKPGGRSGSLLRWLGPTLRFLRKNMCTSELLGFVGVAGDLGGADVGEIEGIEEKHQVFSLIV